MPQEHRRQEREMGPSGQRCGREGEGKVRLSPLSLSPCLSLHAHIPNQRVRESWNGERQMHRHNITSKQWEAWAPRDFQKQVYFLDTCYLLQGLLQEDQKENYVHSLDIFTSGLACILPPAGHLITLCTESYRNMCQGRTLSPWAFRLQLEI